MLIESQLDISIDSAASISVMSLPQTENDSTSNVSNIFPSQTKVNNTNNDNPKIKSQRGQRTSNRPKWPLEPLEDWVMEKLHEIAKRPFRGNFSFRWQRREAFIAAFVNSKFLMQYAYTRPNRKVTIWLGCHMAWIAQVDEKCPTKLVGFEVLMATKTPNGVLTLETVSLGEVGQPECDFTDLMTPKQIYQGNSTLVERLIDLECQAMHVCMDSFWESHVLSKLDLEKLFAMPNLEHQVEAGFSFLRIAEDQYQHYDWSHHPKGFISWTNKHYQKGRGPLEVQDYIKLLWRNDVLNEEPNSIVWNGLNVNSCTLDHRRILPQSISFQPCTRWEGEIEGVTVTGNNILRGFALEAIDYLLCYRRMWAFRASSFLFASRSKVDFNELAFDITYEDSITTSLRRFPIQRSSIIINKESSEDVLELIVRAELIAEFPYVMAKQGPANWYAWFNDMKCWLISRHESDMVLVEKGESNKMALLFGHRKAYYTLGKKMKGLKFTRRWEESDTAVKQTLKRPFSNEALENDKRGEARRRIETSGLGEPS